jgi:hypothetical protein
VTRSDYDWSNFKGYSGPAYTPVPDELLDRQLPHLSGAEVKVLLYLMRQTFGWKRDSEAVSFKRLLKGSARRDGSVFDEGAGVSRSTLAVALEGLEEKGLITVQRFDRATQEANVYAVRMGSGSTGGRQAGPSPEIEPGSNTTASPEIEPGQGRTPSPKIELGLNTTPSPKIEPGQAAHASPKIELGASPEIELHKRHLESPNGLSSENTGQPPVVPLPTPDASPVLVLVAPDEEEPGFVEGCELFVAEVNVVFGRKFQARDPKLHAKYRGLRQLYARTGGRQGFSHFMLIAVARGAGMDDWRRQNPALQEPISILRGERIQSHYLWGSGQEAPPPPSLVPVASNPSGSHAKSNGSAPAPNSVESAMARAAAARARQSGGRP